MVSKPQQCFYSAVTGSLTGRTQLNQGVSALHINSVHYTLVLWINRHLHCLLFGFHTENILHQFVWLHVFILLFSSIFSVSQSHYLSLLALQPTQCVIMCAVKRHLLCCVCSDSNHFIVCIWLTVESCSHRPRSTSCWFTTLMPSSTTRNIEMQPANTAWHCSRRRCSAKHLKSVLLLVEPRPTYRHRCVL